MDYRVISADDHIDLRWMPQDLWSERLPVHLRERGPRVRETERGPHWFCDGKMWGAWGTYSGAQGSGVKWAIEMGGALREGELRPTIAEMRLADMDRDGVDASVMYGPTDPFVIADAELRRAVYEVYNDWLQEDRVMWASDYPHPASTWPDSQQVIEKTMRGVDPSTRQKVLVGNAIKLDEL